MTEMQWSDRSIRKLLRDMFDAAVASASPKDAIPRYLPERPKGRCVVVGAGKASAAMAAALDAAWPDVELEGVVVTRYGHAVPSGRIKIIEASHPVPDERSVVAATEILAAVRGLGPDDLVVALISGGGSSLLVSPAGAMTLVDKKAVNQALLASGATISEMNTVRRHLSGIKGGRLAKAAQPAQLVTLIISDVPGDNPLDIASGPTIVDLTSKEDARNIVARYRLNLPDTAHEVLQGAEDPRLNDQIGRIQLIATPAMALDAAAEVARRHGVTPLVLGDALEGEAKELGRVLAGISMSAKTRGLPIKGPAVLLSGGEGTVTLGDAREGRGGRNTEFLLSLALQLKAMDGIWAIAGDTDGIDGIEDAAGAMISPDSLNRMKEKGVNPREALDAHDSYTAFKAIDDLILIGPTLTNVNDIRAIMVV